jgi:hypothetical protein
MGGWSTTPAVDRFEPIPTLVATDNLLRHSYQSQATNGRFAPRAAELGATSSAKEHHMHIDRLQRIPEPIEQVIRQNISEVASAVVRSAGGD